jgi:hypothetical protein
LLSERRTESSIQYQTNAELLPREALECDIDENDTKLYNWALRSSLPSCAQMVGTVVFFTLSVKHHFNTGQIAIVDTAPKGWSLHNMMTHSNYVAPSGTCASGSNSSKDKHADINVLVATWA